MVDNAIQWINRYAEAYSKFKLMEEPECHGEHQTVKTTKHLSNNKKSSAREFVFYDDNILWQSLFTLTVYIVTEKLTTF